MAIVEPNHDVEVLEQRRRHWLGIICAGLLLTIGLATWWHVTDPSNPYRDGTTHEGVLVHTNPPCINGWTVTLGSYTWVTAQAVPQPLIMGPTIGGTIHIVHQRVDDTQSSRGVAAWFEADGYRIAMRGGREPWISDLSCAIR